MLENFKIEVIFEGIVIDYILVGKWFKVIEIFGLIKLNGGMFFIVLNVFSKKFGRKDIVKVEGRYLSEEEVNKIVFIVLMVIVNIVKDYKIIEKFNVEIFDEIMGIFKCLNLNCVSNYEYVMLRFYVESREFFKFCCYYCERMINEDEIV